MLVLNPNPVLRRRVTAVTLPDPFLVPIITEMFTVMDSHYGIGLAAPQIGKSLAIITYQIFDKRGYLINPVITGHGSEKVFTKEKCLSLPGEEVEIGRWREVSIVYQDINNQRFSIKAKDLYAVCLQHEMDHLIGKLITDYRQTK